MGRPPIPNQLALPGRFSALDGWRGICALLVALYHFHTTSHIEHVALVRHAYLFVDFFFVLSGFVIAYAYAGRLASLRDAGTMIWRRLGRLWPLHVALLAALVALEAASPVLSWVLGAQRSAAEVFDPAGPSRPSAILSNLLLVQGLGLHDQLTWNFPSWSISAELWTCVVFAVAAVLASRWFVGAALALIAGSAAIILICSTHFIAVEHDFGLFRCMAGFFVGTLVHRLVRVAPARLPAPTVLEIAAVLGIGAFVVAAGKTPWEYAAPLVFGTAVWLFAWERGAVSKLLKTRPVALLGLVSYSIYMVHSVVITLLHRACAVVGQRLGLDAIVLGQHNGAHVRFVSFGTPWEMDALVLVYLIAVVALSWLTWRYIEMPAQRAWNAGGSGTRAAPEPAVTSPGSA